MRRGDAANVAHAIGHLPDYHRRLERDGMTELQAHIETLRLQAEIGVPNRRVAAELEW